MNLKELWPKLCDLGVIELRINDKLVWADDALDFLVEEPNYSELVYRYNKRVEEYITGEDFDSFIIEKVNIEIVEFHHSVCNVIGKYE